MLTNLATNPISLGKLIAGATFATVSIPIVKNLTATYPDIAAGGVGTVHIDAFSTNTGSIYICSSAANPDKTNYTNVLQILLGGGSVDLNSTTLNNVPLGNLYIGADNATDFAIGYFLQR